MILHVARAKDICYLTRGQFNSGIGIDDFLNGINTFGIEVCNKNIKLPKLIHHLIF